MRLLRAGRKPGGRAEALTLLFSGRSANPHLGVELRKPPKLEGELSRIAARQGRNSEALVFEAVERFIGRLATHDDWFAAKAEKGFASAERNEFVEHSAVRLLIDSRYPV